MYPQTLIKKRNKHDETAEEDEGKNETPVETIEVN